MTVQPGSRGVDVERGGGVLRLPARRHHARAARGAQHAARRPPGRRVPRVRLEGRRGRALQARLPGPRGRPGRPAAEPAAGVHRGAADPARADGATLEALARRLTGTGASPTSASTAAGSSGSAGLPRGVRWAGWILGAVLLIAAVLTVATVVRLALHARRDEVEIMQLMGAPDRPAARSAGGRGDPAGRCGSAGRARRALRRHTCSSAAASLAVLGPAFDAASFGFLPAGLSALVVRRRHGRGVRGRLSCRAARALTHVRSRN